MKPSCCGLKRSLDGILGKLPGIPSTRKWMAWWGVFQEKMMRFSLDGVVKLCLLSGKGWNVWCKKGGQVAKVANEQVIRQLVNACPGKITLVHLHLHHQRTPPRLFKHRLGWVILVRCDIANQVIATGKEGWRKVLRKKSAAISERSIAKILRHWFKLATWGHYFAYLSLIGMGVTKTGLATKITYPFWTINWVSSAKGMSMIMKNIFTTKKCNINVSMMQFEKLLLAKFYSLAWHI